MQTPGYSPKIRHLLEGENLPGLETELRRPGHPANRVQAAQALGDLENMEATQSLVRAMLKDPDAEVKAAARQALDVLLGSNAEIAIATYRAGPPEQDEWLQEPLEGEEGEEETPFFGQELTQTDIDGLIQITRHEGNPGLRLQAIQTLGASADLRAINALVDVALWSDEKRVRHAAYEALARRFGSDQAREMVAVQRRAALEEANDRGEELELPGDEAGGEEFTREVDQDGGLVRSTNSIVAEDDEIEDDQDDYDELEDDSPRSAPLPVAAPEIQTPWQVFLAAAVITTLIILALILLIK